MGLSMVVLYVCACAYNECVYFKCATKWSSICVQLLLILIECRVSNKSHTQTHTHICALSQGEFHQENASHTHLNVWTKIEKMKLIELKWIKTVLSLTNHSMDVDSISNSILQTTTIRTGKSSVQSQSIVSKVWWIFNLC